MKCPTCKGTGKYRMKVTTVEPGKETTVSHFMTTCDWCDGTGQRTPEQQKAAEAFAAAWCRCKALVEEEYRYVEKGHSLDVFCKRCGGYVQCG